LGGRRKHRRERWGKYYKSRGMGGTLGHTVELKRKWGGNCSKAVRTGLGQDYHKRVGGGRRGAPNKTTTVRRIRNGSQIYYAQGGIAVAGPDGDVSEKSLLQKKIHKNEETRIITWFYHY